MTAPPNANNPNFLLIGERFGLFILSVILKSPYFRVTAQNRFLKCCDKQGSLSDTGQAVFCAYKRRQIGCVGIIGESRVYPDFLFCAKFGET